ncbi:MAG: hypothetical protein KF899_09705 [Parvibaculum sp.]|nr:hypothetical protein [Parvibaculum sp.]
MAAKTPAALLDSGIEAVWAILRAARPDEIDNLTWRSPLAERISHAVCTVFPFSTIDRDLRNAHLLLAASNACSSGVGLNLDIGLAIGARALHRRILNIELAGPMDVLARFDILLVHIREAWITDNDDLVWFVSQLRKQFAAAISTPSFDPPGKQLRSPDSKHLAILKLITGDPPEKEPAI